MLQLWRCLYMIRSHIWVVVWDMVWIVVWDMVGVVVWVVAVVRHDGLRGWYARWWWMG
jgi:hypothetical protein